jgi:hypothetical protein
MPVTRRGNPLYDNIDQTNAAGFLFRDDDSAMDSNYAGLDTPGDEGFPKLIAQKDNPNRVSYFPSYWFAGHWAPTGLLPPYPLYCWYLLDLLPPYHCTVARRFAQPFAAP